MGSPRYRLTCWIFLRGLALVALVAFVSYGVQLDGLIGSRGLLPAADYLERVDEVLEARREAGESGSRWLLPTLCWLASSDAALRAMVWGGAALALLAALGVAQGWLLLALWVLYLSLVLVGQAFLSFQWDSLLLETLLVSLLLAPWSLRPRPLGRQDEPSRLAVFALRFLLFKLMFLSGAVKLLSMDDAWWQLGALDAHYFTQPLPTWTSWYAHQLPAWLQRLSVAVMFAIELVAPFFVFCGRRLRTLAFLALVGLQLLIAMTGNYGFFNLLTVVLCLSVLDDRLLARPSGGRGASATARPAPFELPPVARVRRHLRAFAAVALVVVSFLTLVREMVQTTPRAAAPGWLAAPLAAADRLLLGWGQPLILDRTDPFRSISGYGLFRAMTMERPEIVVEVSADGERWSEVAFRSKPGDPARRPRFTGPHMPRLDWQMWFAALNPPRAQGWLFSLARALLERNPTVLELIDESRLPSEPIRLVRFQLYDYRFTSPDVRQRSGAWWTRTLRGPLLPRPLTVVDLRGAEQVDGSDR